MEEMEEINKLAEKRGRVSDKWSLSNETVAESELDSIITEQKSQTSKYCKPLEDNDSNSTTTDEDLDPISAFMQLATEEVSTSKSKKIAERIASSIAAKEKQMSKSTDVELLETESESSDAGDTLKENSILNGTNINRTLGANHDLTEKEVSMIIEEDALVEDLRTEEVLPTSPVLHITDALPTSSTTPSANPPSPPRTLDNLITDTSTLLLDYELRIQGKYMCDVIEIPEHILVITIPKAKELKLSNSNYWPNNEEKQVPRSLLDIPPDITISRTLSEEMRENRGMKSLQTEEIDYVYYMGEDENPRRDREVQVDIEITTKDFGNQCDAEFDISLISRDSKLRPNCPADLNKRECLVCGEILPNYVAQVKHFALHDNSVPSLCSFCGVTFSSSEKLLAHEKYFHGKFMMDINEAMRCPKPFCNKAFYSKKQLHDHIEEHIGNITYKCYICLRTFNSSLQLFRHQRTSKFCLNRKQLKQNMFFRRMLEC